MNQAEQDFVRRGVLGRRAFLGGVATGALPLA